MRNQPLAKPLDDDPTIVWDPDLQSPAPAGAPLPAEVVRALPNPLAYAPVTLAAMPLLAAIIAFRRVAAMNDIGALRHNMIAAVKRFEQAAIEANTHADDVVAARYLLCCAVDEAIATTSLLGDTDWSKNSLLVSFHNESWGGDKAFVLIEHLRQDTKRYADLLQLAFFILALGFEGRYRVINNGLLQLEELRAEIARQIDVPRPDLAPKLALVQRPLQLNQRSALHVPIWTSMLAAVLLLAVLLVYLGASIDREAEPTVGLVQRVEHVLSVPRSPDAQPVPP
jgi:type VI secretion system protein ImpK